MGIEDAAFSLPPGGPPKRPEEEGSLVERLEKFRAENAVLRRSVLAPHDARSVMTEGQRATLNLLEDAVAARRQAEGFNAQLRAEIERRQAVEDALTESAERLRLALGAAALGTFVWHVEGERIETDARMRALLGLPPEGRNPSGEELLALIHPDDRAPHVLAVERAMDAAGGGVLRDDLRICSADGSCRWLSVHGQVYFEGEPRRAVRIAGAALDITPRKQAEETLRASEERFRVALEAAEMAAWDYDVGRDRAVWNAQHFRLLGMEPRAGEVTSRDLLAAVHPEDAAMVGARLREAVEKTGVYRVDFRIVRVDTGEVRWMSGFGRAMSWANGHATRMTGVMLDITERHAVEEGLAAAQERLRLLVESALEHAIVSMDLERRVTSWNHGAEAIHGYSKEEMIGRSADIMFTPEDRADGAPEREHQAALEKGHADDNRWMQRKDGTRFWANGAMLPMRARSDGEVIGFVKILRDQTEMQRAREALEAALLETEQARSEAEAAGQAKDQFLAVLSHELRTPLTPVSMALHLLARNKALPPAVRAPLDMIRRNVRLETQLVDDLLDVTRISRGKLELAREPMDGHEVITQAVEVTHPDLEAKNQPLTVSLGAAEHRLEGDPHRLQQVFWNLLKNASKFTPAGGGIRVESRNEAGRLVVEVRDTGIGFDADASERIFTAFEQASQEVTRKFGGLGLGLAISKAVVEAHGGTIRAASEGPGKGAAFTVELPLGAGKPGALEKARRPEQASL